MSNEIRNMNLHPAFQPSWEPPEFAPQVVVPQGDTSVDPFRGSRWGDFFDAMGAKEPGGAHFGMASSALPKSPAPLSLQGLQAVAQPKVKR